MKTSPYCPVDIDVFVCNNYDDIYAEIKAMVEVEGCLIQIIGQKTPDFSCPMVQKLLYRLDQKINMSVARGYTTPISIRLSLLNQGRIFRKI